MRILIWSITEFCNLRCGGCNAWQKRKIFDMNNLDKFIKELKLNNIRVVSITGGEPTLHPNIFEIVKKLKKEKVWVHIATNGSKPEVLLELSSHLDAVSVSLDSDDENEHDTYRGIKVYRKALESIENLRGKVKIITANMLVTSFNYNKVDRIARFANRVLGVPLSICYPEFDGYLYKPFDVNKDQLRSAFKYAYSNYNNHIFGNIRSYYLDVIRYLDGKKTYPCRAGDIVFYADADTRVRPCFMKDEIIINDEIKWKKYKNECNDCMVECFREPSIPNRLEQIMLIFRIWKYTHRRITR